MKIAGWSLVLVGLAWIGFAEFGNLVIFKTAIREVTFNYPPDRTYTQNDVINAIRQTSVVIADRVWSSTWGGLLMLAGALILEVSHVTKRK